ncbi:MAG TPA: hypothetical protein HA286_03875 [Candidatus Poseidoniaceae archaeon]|nr:MAG TPA: hypothetical protein D7H96_03810 [Candidatus Poseidoniales archaeon]HIH53397.1 hypothetical protein [Candidatus Poseidoniaceae archaeon]
MKRAEGQLNAAERVRQRSGAMARHPASQLGRKWLCMPLVMGSVVILAAPTANVASPLALLAIWAPFSLLVTSFATMAGEATQQVLRARIQLRAWGGGPDGQSHDLKAQPGLDLVQEGINELRRVNAAQAMLIGTSALLLLTASAITTGSVGWNLAVLLVIVTGVAQGWHAQVTADKMLQLGDPYPLLISFVPTHHSTQFDGTLSDLVLAHLDPDLVIDWKAWCSELVKAALDPRGPRLVRERTLLVLALHHDGHFDDASAMMHLDDLLGQPTVDRLLLDESAVMNWRSVQRLIQHALASQPNAALLLTRLLGDTVGGTVRRTGRDWRVDTALGPVCERGTGHLFVLVHHWGEGRVPAHIEILAPGGEPSRRNQRIVVEGCRALEEPIDLRGKDRRAAMDRLVEHVDRSTMLWFRLAWPTTLRGSTRVQVHLKDGRGRLIDARVLRTELRPTARGGARALVRRLVTVRSINEWPLPKRVEDVLTGEEDA